MPPTTSTSRTILAAEHDEKFEWVTPGTVLGDKEVQLLRSLIHSAPEMSKKLRALDDGAKQLDKLRLSDDFDGGGDDELFELWAFVTEYMEARGLPCNA